MSTGDRHRGIERPHRDAKSTTALYIFSRYYERSGNQARRHHIIVGLSQYSLTANPFGK